MVALADLHALRSEIDSLDRYLLSPLTVRPPDPLTPADQIAVRAYLILAHAAVEETIEACFADYVADALVADAGGRVDPGLYLTILELGDDLAGRLNREVRTPDAVLNLVPHLFVQKFCKPNNGVRRKSVRQLAQGAGLDWPRLDDACGDLIGALDTLGSKRGAVAHVSTAGPQSPGIAQELYPENVREFVRAAIDELPTIVTFLGARPALSAANRRRRLKSRARDLRSWMARSWSERPR